MSTLPKCVDTVVTTSPVNFRPLYFLATCRLQYDLDGEKMEKKPSVANRSRAHLMSVMERRLGVYPGLVKLWRITKQYLLRIDMRRSRRGSP